MLIQMSVHCFNRENLKESLILPVFLGVSCNSPFNPYTHIHIYIYILYIIYICTYIYGKMGLAKYCATKSELYIMFFFGGGLDFHEVCSGSGGVQFLHLGLAISFA